MSRNENTKKRERLSIHSQEAATTINFQGMSLVDLRSMWKATMEKGMHGLCISPYEEGQAPGSLLTEEQVIRRLTIIQPYTSWIRSFSCTEGNELIPRIAKELGMKTLVGAWLGTDTDKNKEELDALIDLANRGEVDIAAVGNEVMYRRDLTEDQLLEDISYVKSRIDDGIPVGYVDAYYEFYKRPRITEACDLVLANCYPFWEGCEEPYALDYMKNMYERAVQSGNGKRVIITETGWPSQGSNFENAHPSEENAIKYFINTQKWSTDEEIDIFYFSSFDESWKVRAEGDVGAYWGLWDKDERLKF